MSNHDGHMVFSQERVTVLYSVERVSGTKWHYTGMHTLTLDETAEPFGLYCQDCDEEIDGDII